jgi:hypothetical protein
MLYGRFVGSWDVLSTQFTPDGRRMERRGEWHFSWVLGGSGIQDVLFEVGAPAHKYGTTLRCYDASIDAWHITWMMPSGGEFVNLIGRQVGDRIVQEGKAVPNGPLQRWTFSSITDDAFLWRGESSSDGGQTWSLDQLVEARRRR